MRLKKAFAVILAIAMVFGVVSMASAAVTVGGFDDAVESKHANQLAYLRATGIAKGDEKGNFNPEALLTRQEFATFVARLAKQDSAANFLRSTPTRYSDDAVIADWARGEINLADSNGWVKGRDDGNFHPSDNLTYAEAVTVLVRLLGHEPAVSGAWPDGHIIKSINLGITANVELTDKNKNTPISRGDMGRLLYNSMFIKTMKHDVHDRFVDGQDSLYEANSFTGKVTEISASSIKLDAAASRDFAEDVTVIGFPTTAMNALMGQNVRIHTNASNKVTVVMLLGDVKLGGRLTFEKFDSETTADTGWKTVNFIVFSDGSKVKFNPDKTTYSYNGTTSLNPDTSVAPKINALALEKGDWMVITESDGTATHVDITHFAPAHRSQVLTADGKARTKSTEEDRIAYGTEYSVGGAIINLNGESAAVTDLKKDDVVDVAFRYEWKAGAIQLVDQANSLDVLYHVEATRKVVEGTYVSRRTTNAGGDTTNFVTIKLADGTNKEYEYDFDPVPGYVPGSKVAFILDGRNVVVKDLSGQSALASNAYKVIGGENDGTNYRVQIDHKGEKMWLTVNAGANTETLYNTITGAAGTVQYLELSVGGQVTAREAIKWTADGVFASAAVDLTVKADWDPAEGASYVTKRNSLLKVLSAGDVVILDGPILTEDNPAAYGLKWVAGTTNAAVAGDAVTLAKDARVLTGFNASGELVALLVVPAP